MTELSKEARALLEAARPAEDPRPADRARVLAALSARLALPPMVDPSVAGTTAASGTTAAAAKVGLGLGAAAKVKTIVVAAVVATAGGVGTWKVVSQRASEGPARVQQRQRVTTPSAAAAPGSPTLAAAPPASRAASRAGGRRARFADAAGPSTPRQPRARRRAAPVVEPRAVAASRPVAALDDPGLEQPATGDGPGAPAATVLRQEQAPPKPAPRSAVARCDTGAELALLQRAQAALRARDGKRALGALSRHARNCPTPTFGEEARAARVLALCFLERVAEARRELERLRRAAPRSPHLARLRSSCVDRKKP